jgi:hypothetical protein
VNVCVKATTNRQEISSSHNVYVNVTWLLNKRAKNIKFS